MKRRKFVSNSIKILGGSSMISIHGKEIIKGRDNNVRFGVVADPHYADRVSGGNRFYKQSLDKLSECVEVMNAEDVDFLIELGDFKDQGVSPNEKETLSFLETVEKEFQKFRGPIYHVLGNHDTDSISKSQFLKRINNTGFSEATNYYSFNSGHIHFIVLDANYSSEGVSYDHGNINWTDCHVPERQLDWLEDDLKRNLKPTIVFIHQQLDSSAFDKDHEIFCPDNSDEVRTILENAGNVPIVFQGHYHNGSFNIINGINYYTLRAVIEGEGLENSGYIIVEVDENLKIKIKGYRKAVSKYLL